LRNGLFNLVLNDYTLSRDAIAKAMSGVRDLDAACGYPPDVTKEDFKAMFDRNGVGTRVVELYPKECWATEPGVYETEDEDETEFEKAWDELNKQFNLFDYLERIDVLSGIGRYGLLILGLSDGLTLDKPVEKTKGLQLLYLKVVDESVVTIKSKDIDVTSPRFGKPVTYEVKFETLANNETAYESKTVHYTRVLHVADGRLTSDTFGVPRMKNVYNYLLDLKKVGGGSAEMFWRGGYPGLSIKTDPDRTTPLTDDEKTDIKAELKNYTEDLQRFLALSNVEVKPLEVQIADPTPNVMMIIKLISITYGVPYRKLMGSEEAKLASAEDTKDWNKKVTKRQNGYVTNCLIKPFVTLLINLGVLPEPKDLIVDWPDLGALDEKDSADVMVKKTEAMAKYSAGGVGDTLMAPPQYLTMVLKYTDEEAQAILDGQIENVELPDLQDTNDDGGDDVTE